MTISFTLWHEATAEEVVRELIEAGIPFALDVWMYSYTVRVGAGESALLDNIVSHARRRRL